MGIFNLEIIHNDKHKCTSCSELKPFSDFIKSNNNGNKCKACRSKWKKEYYRRPGVKEKERKHFLNSYFKRKYGITYEQYTDMFLKQNGKCAICGKEKNYHDFRSSKRINLAVDHCHKTGKVRGLLCIICNNGLGAFKDDLKLFLKAMRYIKSNQ